MICPKCGAVTEAGREECPVCGIIFARWQPLERKAYPAASPPRNEPASAPDERIAASLPVTVGIILVLLSGTVWTVRRHLRKAEPAHTDLLDQVSQAHLRAARGTGGAKNLELAQQPVPAELPAGLDEAAIRDIVESCSWFSSGNFVRVPLQFQRSEYKLVTERYPGFLPAQQQHLIELDRPVYPAIVNYGNRADLITVKLTSDAFQKLDVAATWDAYDLGIGRRRVRAITSALAVGRITRVRFQWSYEKPVGNAIATDADGRGVADLQRFPWGWVAMRVVNNSKGSTMVICKN
jgi:hypothetical protein